MIKYLETVNEVFDGLNPFLNHYKEQEIGFVGYQLDFEEAEQQ